MTSSSSDRMRIGLVVHEFPPRPVLGGTGRHVASVARGLRAAGHEVSVFTFENFAPAMTEQDDEVDGIPVRRVYPKVPSLIRTIREPEVEQAFGRWLDARRLDLVHFHHTILIGMGLPRIAKERGLPVALSLHDYWLMCQRAHLTYPEGGEHGRPVVCTPPVPHRQCAACVGQLYGATDQVDRLTAFLTMREQYAREALADADLVLCFSEFVRWVFEKANGWPARYETLPSGIEPFAVEPRPVLTTHVPTFGFIGNVAPIKGLDVLLEAFRDVAARARLMVFGEVAASGEYQARLQAQAHGLPSLTFFGRYERAQLPKIFSLIDVLVIPSLLENYPLAALEAQMARVPVVATDAGGLPEIVKDGVNGLLFRRGSAADLAEKLESLVARPARIAELAAGVVPPLTLEGHLQRLLEHYRALVAHRPLASAAGEGAAGDLRMAFRGAS